MMNRRDCLEAIFLLMAGWRLNREPVTDTYFLSHKDKSFVVLL